MKSVPPLKRRYFRYMGFWDMPRNLVVTVDTNTWLLESLFDDEKDDYPDTYQVYCLEVKPNEELEELWRIVLRGQGKTRIGAISIRDIRFNATKRSFFESEAFERLIRQEENNT